MEMKWYFRLAGGHVHIEVFLNGAKCGDLCFRVEEFQHIRSQLINDIDYVKVGE